MKFTTGIIMTIGLLGAAVVDAAASGAAADETRGYVVSWFYPSVAVQSAQADCPHGMNAKDAATNTIQILTAAGVSKADIQKAVVNFPVNAEGALQMRARIKGKPASPYLNPTAMPDLHMKTVEGTAALGFNLDGNAATGGFTDPETGETAGGVTLGKQISDKAFVRAEPILQKMGKRIVHAGGAGAGQAAKICNSMLLAISMIGTCEAFVLGEKLGLDPQKLFDIMSAASGQCWSLTTYCPVPGPVPTAPSNRDYTGGFATALMLKDLKLAQEAALASGATTPLGAEAAQLYALFNAAGHAGDDFSGIINFLRGEK